MANFKLSDIKAGYLLRVKDTDENREFNMTVIPCKAADPDVAFIAKLLGDNSVSDKDGDLACNNPGKDWWPIKHFENNMETPSGMYRVMAVYGYAPPRTLMDNSTEDRELLWEREEAAEPTEGEKNVAPVKMTMAQIQKALGYEVELAEEEE